MGVLTDIYLSNHDEEAISYDTAPEAFADRQQFRNFTVLELSTLWSMGVRRSEWDVRLLDQFPCVVQKDGGKRLIYRLPAEMISDLARLTPEQVIVAAEIWAATEEMACDAEDVRPIIEGLVWLAQAASAKGRSLYLWNCV